MKSAIKYILLFVMAAGVLTSCLKGDEPNFPGGGGTFLEYINNPNAGSTVGAGLASFSATALTFPPTHTADTLVFAVALQGVPNTVGKDITITIAEDPARNNDNYSTDSTTYVSMPDSLYELLNTTAVIHAGEDHAEFTLIFHPNKVDPSKNFMLPISFTNDAGIAQASNFSTLYYHTIGNPLAGPYTVTGTRYNYNGASGWSGTGPYPTPASTAASPTSKLASPSSTTVIKIGFANLGGNGYNYIITYDKTGPSIDVSGDFLAAVSMYKVYTKDITIDPGTGKATFHIVSSYNNQPDGSGLDRIIDETFVQN